MYSSDPAEKLILALDGMNESEVFSLLSEIPEVIWVKVGLELFTLCGPDIIVKLRNKGKRVFLDLKFHDIPTTMSRACYQAAKLQAEIMTIHACAGENAMAQAHQAANKGAEEIGMPPPTLIAVTVLTSWSHQAFISDLDISQSIKARVQHFAELSVRAGIGGCVCSPLEVKDLRINFPEPFELITPGIRFLDNCKDDQERVLSPMEAVRSGASKLVIGRIVTQAPSPHEAFKRVCKELN